MMPITNEIADKMKLSSLNGVYITEVLNGSAADEAGMKKEDILISIDSVKITTTASVQETVNKYHPGDKAVMTVIRDGKEKTLNVVFKGTTAENGTVDEDGTTAFYGAKLKEAPKETLKRLGYRQGVEIVSVGAGKIQEAGGTDGFIILYVNDRPVSKPQDVIDIAGKSKRAIFVEGVTPSGKPGYFAFGL